MSVDVDFVIWLFAVLNSVSGRLTVYELTAIQNLTTDFPLTLSSHTVNWTSLSLFAHPSSQGCFNVQDLVNWAEQHWHNLLWGVTRMITPVHPWKWDFWDTSQQETHRWMIVVEHCYWDTLDLFLPSQAMMCDVQTFHSSCSLCYQLCAFSSFFTLLWSPGLQMREADRSAEPMNKTNKTLLHIATVWDLTTVFFFSP